MSPLAPLFNMIHHEQGIWKYQGPVGSGMRLSEQEKPHAHPHTVPRDHKVLKHLVSQPADWVKPLIVDH